MQLPPGYRLRAPVIEDGPAIADMLNNETVALTGVPLASVEWVTTAWTAPGARLDRDFGVITDSGGAIAGYFMIEFEPPFTTVFRDRRGGAVAPRPRNRVGHHRGGRAARPGAGRRSRGRHPPDGGACGRAAGGGAADRPRIPRGAGVLVDDAAVRRPAAASGRRGGDRRPYARPRPGASRSTSARPRRSRITGATGSRPRNRGCIATSTPATPSIRAVVSGLGGRAAGGPAAGQRRMPRRIPSSGTSACWACAARPAAAASARRCCAAAS